MRRNFSTFTQRRALARANGVCECHLIPHVFAIPCGRKLGPGNTFFEHIDCDQLGGDNTISNIAALTKTCWAYKSARFDLPVIAKSKRRFDRNNGIVDPWKRKLPGGKGSPFKFKIGDRRRPVDRVTGEPYRGRS